MDSVGIVSNKTPKLQSNKNLRNANEISLQNRKVGEDLSKETELVQNGQIENWQSTPRQKWSPSRRKQRARLDI